MSTARPACPRALVIAAGALLTSSSGLAETTVQLQVSPAGQELWSSTLNASAGDSIDVRVRISYAGTAAPLGLAATIFQPTVSNWLTGDQFTPLINGGVGSQTTTPIGAVPDAPGMYGRIIPFATAFMSATNFIRGHVNTVGGTTFLRIAQSQVTSWFGGPGNTTSGSGVNILQLSNIGRTAATPPFNGSVQNVNVFKFNFTLSSSTAYREMLVDAPLAGFAPLNTGFPHVSWFMSMSEATGSLRELPTITGSTIIVNVPAPGTLALGAFTAIAASRRIRRSRA
jgi:hypothetical protein